MHEASSVQTRWSMLVGTGLALLGAVLLLIPVSGRQAVVITGAFVFAAAALELGLSLKTTVPSVRRIELALSAIAFLSALLILANPIAFRLLFVAIFCLGLRGLGAIAAAFLSAGAVRLWFLAQGLVDMLLATILIAGTPLAAVISVIAGGRWPPGSAAILANFIAVSLLAAGISLIGVGIALRNGRDQDRSVAAHAEIEGSGRATDR
jgi:hypothetical protein